MSGEVPDAEGMATLEELYDVLNQNRHICQVFDAERRIGVIIDDINKIIFEGIQLIE